MLRRAQRALLRMYVKAEGSHASVALVALDSSLDGSITTRIPASCTAFANRYGSLNFLTESDSGEGLYPALQVANNSLTETETCYLDNLAVYQLPEDGVEMARKWFGEG